MHLTPPNLPSLESADVSAKLIQEAWLRRTINDKKIDHTNAMVRLLMGMTFNSFKRFMSKTAQEAFLRKLEAAVLRPSLVLRLIRLSEAAGQAISRSDISSALKLDDGRASALANYCVEMGYLAASKKRCGQHDAIYRRGSRDFIYPEDDSFSGCLVTAARHANILDSIFKNHNEASFYQSHRCYRIGSRGMRCVQENFKRGNNPVYRKMVELERASMWAKGERNVRSILTISKSSSSSRDNHRTSLMAICEVADGDEQAIVLPTIASLDAPRWAGFWQKREAFFKEMCSTLEHAESLDKDGDSVRIEWSVANPCHDIKPTGDPKGSVMLVLKILLLFPACLFLMSQVSLSTAKTGFFGLSADPSLSAAHQQGLTVGVSASTDEHQGFATIQSPTQPLTGDAIRGLVDINFKSS